MNYRNRKLLDLAHKVTVCQSCGAHTEGCVPAHANWSKYGKGMSLKANDHWHAALCHPCHMVLDQGKHMDKEQRMDMWERAHIKTMDLYWSNGWLDVK